MKKIYFSCFLFLVVWTCSFGQELDFINDVKSYLEELSQDENFGLTIAISKNNEIILEEAFGFANRAHQIPNTINTPFNIASIGKQFTAVSILQLHEQNKIDLHLPIGKYLPDFPNQGIKDSVTIHQLLTHSSGLPLFWGGDFHTTPKFDYIELDDYISLYENVKIDHSKIGTKSYSNSGFILLGYIIESISGMTYKAYLNENIFKPLEMNHTNVWKLTESIPNAATGYVRPERKGDWWKTNYHINMGSNPAGGAFSSVLDLLKFHNALIHEKILSPKMTELMISPKVEDYDGHYGYGIGIDNKNESLKIGHLGGYFGVRGELMWYKESDFVIAILANSDQTDYIDITTFIDNQLRGTLKEKEAYQNTRELLATDMSKLYFNQQTINDLRAVNYSEVLIQIKAYYHLNNQNYSKAEQLFLLNTVLFPDSRSAQEDYLKVKKVKME